MQSPLDTEDVFVWAIGHGTMLGLGFKVEALMGRTGGELSATTRKPDTWPAGTWAERAIWASERAVEPDGIWKAHWEGFEGRTDDCCGSNAPLVRKLVNPEELVYGLHGGSVLIEGVNWANGWVSRPSDAEGE